MAVTGPHVWLDGPIVEVAQATAPLMGHAVQRGSLVFDVGSFHATARGPALFRAREHVARFMRSARIVGLTIAHDEEALVRAAEEVVRLLPPGKEEGLLRWSAFFGASESDLLPRDGATRVAVAAQLYEDPPRTAPFRVATFDDARKASPEALSPAAKVAAAYLGPLLAKRRAIAAGADEIVLLDKQGQIAEAPTANVFAIKNDTLHTPPVRYVLPGITRDTVLAIAKEEGIATREEPLAPESFETADEAFLTATSFPIAPIGSVNGRALGSAPGPITQRLVQRFDAIQHGRDDAHAAWLRFVR
jgi:branched-chain amino acid aminotransferase